MDKITYNITSARYMADPDGVNVSMMATIDGVDWVIPLEDTNNYYAEIMRQVEAGELVIQKADV